MVISVAIPGKIGINSLTKDTIVFLTIDIFSVLVLFALMYSCCREKTEIQNEQRIFAYLTFCLITEMFVDTHYVYFNGNADRRTETVIYSTLFFLCSVLLFYFFHRYVSFFATKKKITSVLDALMYTTLICSAVAVILNVYFKFLFYVDDYGFYVRAKTYNIWYVFVILMSLLVFFRIYVTKTDIRQKFVLYGYMLIPLVAVFVQDKFHTPFIQDGMETIALLLLYTDIHIKFSRQLAVEKTEKAEQAAELEDAKTKVILSQIQPHFMYNTLATISYLCVKTPERAQSLTNDFSDYLRADLSALDVKGVDYFSKELRHIEKYTEIEKVRFEDRLNVVYDIKTTDFKLPLLTVEPLVENSIKHGLCRKKEGGTVEISTYETDEFYVITVKDDGVGFDSKGWNENTPDHVGLKSVKTRIEKLCNGEFTIESEVGCGSTATIKLPKYKEANI